MSEYSRRYWVGADGGELEAVSCCSANNHVSIAIGYLRSRGEPVPSNDCRVYAAMFGRGFMRVIAEEEMGITDAILVDNNGLPVTPAQSQYLRALRGRHPNVRIIVNDQAFESIQPRQASAGKPMGGYMIRDRVGVGDWTRRTTMNGTMPDRTEEHVMNNIHALWDNLAALNEGDRNYFDGCKEHLGQDSSILWYPSSGADFRDLIHTHPGLWDNGGGRNGMEAFPDLFVHTDYNPLELQHKLPRSCFQRRPPPWPREQQGQLGLDDEAQFPDPAPPPTPHNPVLIHDDGRTRITAIRLVPLVLNNQIEMHRFTTWGGDTEENWLAGKAAFMEMSIHSNKLGWFTRHMLYLFYENCNFFNEFVLGRGLKVSHLVHIRDGAGYGGGWGVSMDFLHRYVGFMGVKHLITEYSFPTGTNRFLTQCRRARRVLNSPGNPRADRIELCTVPWSDDGTATVYRLRPEPAALWGRTRRRVNRVSGVGAPRRPAFAGTHARLAGRRPE